MDADETARREKARAKAAWARHASGSVVGSGPPASYFSPPRRAPVDWNNPGLWPFSSSRRVFLAEAVRRMVERSGGLDVASGAGRAAAVLRLRQALADGDVTAFERDEDGEDHQIGASFWALPEAVEVLETCRVGESWIMVDEPPPVFVAVAPIADADPLAKGESAARRAPAVADALAFTTWADGLFAERGHGPIGNEATAWANQRGLSRDWARDQYNAYPADRRLKRGHKNARRASK